MQLSLGMVQRDFIIGGISSGHLRGLDQHVPAQSAVKPAATLVQRYVRRGHLDLVGLTREVLIALRGPLGAAERALFLVRLLSELTGEARGLVAFNVVTRLTPIERNHIGRAGLLALDAAFAEADESLREVARRALAGPLRLARRAPRLLAGSVFIYAEAVSAEVVEQASQRLHRRSPGGVFFIAAVDDARLSPQDWTELLQAEARLSHDATLARFADTAAANRRTLMSEREFWQKESPIGRTLAWIIDWVWREMTGDDPMPDPRGTATGAMG